ncbi:MAG: hypothetical protein PSX81_06730, partial [bacterium]|nr:hypothetical protein [bacterium]
MQISYFKLFSPQVLNLIQEIAYATNKLFEVGFYLLNIGYALLILRFNQDIFNYQTMIELLSAKIGGFSIYLGIMLFLNLYLFFRGKRKSKEQRAMQMTVKTV